MKPSLFSLPSFAFHLAAIALLILATALPARADFSAFNGGVSLTWNNTNLTVVEGDSYVVDFTVFNGTGETISAGTFGPLIEPSTGPDTSDALTGSTNTFGLPGSCSGNLAAGASCDFTVTFFTDPATGETDADFGQQNVVIDVSGVNVGGFPLSFDVSLMNVITVTDPPVTTPEPSSLVLLCGAMLGAGPLLLRRRIAQA